MTTRPSLAIAIAILLTSTLPAQVPQVPKIINYQGRITVKVGGVDVNFTGDGEFKFALINGTTSVPPLWTNSADMNGDGIPDDAETVHVEKGLYSFLLGNENILLGPIMNPIHPSVFNPADVRLRVWFRDKLDPAQTFALLAPDQPIAAVGYAMVAANAVTVADGAITSDKIVSGAVGSAQIANGAITSVKIASGDTRFNINNLTGNVGIGTVAARELLVIEGMQAALEIHNLNDPEAGFIENTYHALQLGMHFAPPNLAGKQAMFGFDVSGRVGSLINFLDSPNPPDFRNLLDDGNGNMSATGNINWGGGLLLTNPQHSNGGIELGHSSSNGETPYIDFHYGENSGDPLDYNVRLINDGDRRLTLEVPGSGTPISGLEINVASFGSAANAQASHFFRVRDMFGGPGASPLTAFVIRGDGRVGIGTDDPATKLHVDGDLRLGTNTNGQ